VVAVDPESLRRRYATYKAAAGLLLFIVGLLGFIGAESFKGHFIAAALATSLLVWASAARLASCRGCGERRLGEIAVQGGWLWTSFSLAYASLAPARIYNMDGPVLALVEAISLALLVGGALFLLIVKQETKAALTV
jgi:hypothetical protein